MSNLKLYVLFYPFKSRLNKKNECPLKCRITIEKVRKEFSTGIFIEPDKWDGKSQSYNDGGVNSEVELIETNLKSAFLKLKVSSDKVTVEDLYRSYVGESVSNDKGVNEFCSDYLAELKKLIGKEIKEVTWNKFNYMGNHLKNFIKNKFRTNDIPLKELNLKFLDDFDFFLKTNENHKQVTINKILQRFRKVVKVAVAENYIDSNPFLLYKPKKVSHKVVYLTPEELKEVEKYKFDNTTLRKVRDCFVFCCYTGLAFLEMRSLKYEHIRTGFDGQDWIFMDREKTNKPLSIPILKKAQDIIDEYQTDEEYVLPKMSNQKFNKYLKKIGLKLKINKRLTHHTARRTFATTVLLYNDVPMEIVSELLGHSSITITEAHYGKIVQKKVSDSIFKLKDKLDIEE